mgnify:CR=1 FL=1
MKTVKQFSLETINRGICDYTITQDKKGYYAHELGELTQWAKVMQTGERKAYRIGINRRRGNQYGTQWVIVPYASLELAELAAIGYSQVRITHS